MTGGSAQQTGEPAFTQEPASGRLLRLLEEGGARFRRIEHEAEGRTDVVSALRGNDLAQAAKCVVVRVKKTKKTSHYVLATVPGDRRVDLGRIAELCEARHAMFADQPTAERLTGCTSGAIVPFTFDPALELVVDPALLAHEEMFFNIELDRSLALDTEDYVRLAEPRVESISEELAVSEEVSADSGR
ncbi:YbaK/EbsC family protein [Streptomyces sp. UNOC14_S4]|uniref:YbaK/EbsC family protein n=1 Tax=Streptomyces sp. UNOC14_S4 TaxID=2872340 RepID=UPI001E466CB5|nr:YbaK/EbsC family protein [Streptomyces sp. UNOC14_S4]MCC3766438.1 YbaK/prolyl-tRNA synthetase associated domain-containing protein [Streptomyces sp. UNOC14_S4]